MRVLLTRPRADSERIAADLARRGIDSVIWPMMEVRALTDAISVPSGTDAIAFTSANAVSLFAEHCGERDLPALCVGNRTAMIAREIGFRSVRSADGDLGDLARLIESGGWSQIFHPRGRHVAGDLGAALHGAGALVEDAEIYMTEPTREPDAALSAELLSEKIHVATVWSARSAQLFCEAYRAFEALDLSGATALAISENAAKPLESAGFRQIAVASVPSAGGMIAALEAQATAMRQ